MDERKAKGTIFLDFVKMIKANNNLDWNKYLKPEDWDVLDAIILPSKWYPFDLYHRCSQAVFHLVGKGDLKMAHADGQRVGRKLFETTYKSLIQRKDPMLGLNQFVSTYGSLFNFSVLRIEKVGPRQVRIFHDYDARDRAAISFCHQLKGILEVLIEMTEGRNAKVVIDAKQWEGAPATSFEVTWE